MISKETAKQLAKMDGGTNAKCWYYRDDTGRGIGCYNVGSGPDSSWGRYFKQPFKRVELSNEDYWLTKTGHLNMDDYFQ